MAKAEWGTKRECPSCATRYYDLGQEPPVCPRCGTEFTPATQKAGYQAPPPPVEPVRKPKPEPRVADEAEVEEPIVADDEEAEEFVEDEEDFVEDEGEDEVFEPEPEEK